MLVVRDQGIENEREEADSSLVRRAWSILNYLQLCTFNVSRTHFSSSSSCFYLPSWRMMTISVNYAYMSTCFPSFVPATVPTARGKRGTLFFVKMMFHVQLSSADIFPWWSTISDRRHSLVRTSRLQFHLDFHFHGERREKCVVLEQNRLHTISDSTSVLEKFRHSDDHRTDFCRDENRVKIVRPFALTPTFFRSASWFQLHRFEIFVDRLSSDRRPFPQRGRDQWSTFSTRTGLFAASARLVLHGVSFLFEHSQSINPLDQSNSSRIDSIRFDLLLS